jgi:hypothetical protein
MIYNLVTVDVVPGKMAELSEGIVKELMPLQQKLGMKQVGSFRAYTGNMNQIYWLFAYDDLTAYNNLRQAQAKDPAWQKVNAKLYPFRAKVNYTLLEPNPWSPMK